MNILALLVIILGVFVTADGIGSVIVHGGQYHGVWFDREREVRALAGIILMVIGYLLR